MNKLLGLAVVLAVAVMGMVNSAEKPAAPAAINYGWNGEARAIHLKWYAISNPIESKFRAVFQLDAEAMAFTGATPLATFAAKISEKAAAVQADAIAAGFEEITPTIAFWLAANYWEIAKNLNAVALGSTDISYKDLRNLDKNAAYRNLLIDKLLAEAVDLPAITKLQAFDFNSALLGIDLLQGGVRAPEFSEDLIATRFIHKGNNEIDANHFSALLNFVEPAKVYAAFAKALNVADIVNVVGSNGSVSTATPLSRYLDGLSKDIITLPQAQAELAILKQRAIDARAYYAAKNLKGYSAFFADLLDDAADKKSVFSQIGDLIAAIYN
jgi:hypothetical protein